MRFPSHQWSKPDDSVEKPYLAPEFSLYQIYQDVNTLIQFPALRTNSNLPFESFALYFPMIRSSLMWRGVLERKALT